MNGIAQKKPSASRGNGVFLLLTLLTITTSVPACRKKTEYRSASDVPRKAEITLPDGTTRLRVDLALTEAEKTQGLSGMPADRYQDDQAMFFFYPDTGPRRFWMPDTYFDLDIFFLDPDLRVLDIERDVKHHPGRSTPPEIPMTRTILSTHILEIKASSPIAKSIKIGDQLKWTQGADLKALRKLVTGSGVLD